MQKTKKIILISFLIIITILLIIFVNHTETKNMIFKIEKRNEKVNESVFSVKFSGTPVVSDESKVKASIVDEHYATLNVEGLTSKGDFITATYILQNTSSDLSAALAIETFNSNKEYFSIKSELDKNILVAGEATKVTVTVELIKTPIKESVSSVVGIGPVQSDS